MAEIFINYYDCLNALVRLFPGQVETYFEIPGEVDDNPEAYDKWDAEHPLLRRLWNSTLFACYDKQRRPRTTRVRSGELTKLLYGYGTAMEILGMDGSLILRYHRAVMRLRSKKKKALNNVRSA